MIIVSLLDLEGNAIEHLVQDSRGLPRLDHRDVEPAEDLRVASQCLQEEATSTSARSLDDRPQVLVLGLLLEDDEGADDREVMSIIVANWREKI